MKKWIMPTVIELDIKNTLDDDLELQCDSVWFKKWWGCGDACWAES